MADERPDRFASLELNPAREAATTKAAGAPLRDADYYMKDALRRELAGNHEKALNQYSRALGENPLHLEAWEGQLWMLLYLGEPTEACLWADRAMESFPNHPDLLSLKSIALARRGALNEAWTLNDAAMSSGQRSAVVWMARGELRLSTEGVGAEACFRNALAASTDRPVTALRCGDICLLHRCYPEAESYLREATAGLPDSAWVWYRCGLAQHALGWETPAKAAFTRANRLAPGNNLYEEALTSKYGLLDRLKQWLYLK